VPDTIPETSGIKLSPEMTKIANRAVQKQQQIHDTFLAEVGKIRAAYQAKLKAEVVAAENSGKAALGATLRKEFTAASDTAQWLKSFGVDPTPGIVPVVTEKIGE